MKRSVNLSVICALCLSVLLFIVPYVGKMGEWLYTAFYALAFVVPLVLTLALCRLTGVEFKPLPLKIKRDGVANFLPLVVPTVAAIMLISLVTSWLLSKGGITDTTTLSGTVPMIYLMYAVIPAVGEELLFRFVPISLVAPYSKKNAVLVSAILFALVHFNLLQLPYALFAGVVFAALDIMCDSILPSVVIHLLNNAISITLALYPSVEKLTFVIIMASAALLTCMSIAFAFLKRKRYLEEMRAIISHGSVVLTKGFAVFAVAALAFTILLLF